MIATKIKQNVLIDLLRQVKEVLDEHCIEFWLDCGTLLGAVRDGKFIPWERDIDFGSWRENVSNSVKISISKELCGRGFKVWISENHMTIKKEELWADVNFYRVNDDKAILPMYYSTNLIGTFLAVFSKVLSVPYYYEVDFRENPTMFVRNILIMISRALPSLLRKRLAKILSVIYEKIGCRDVPLVIPISYFSDLSTITFYGMEFRVPAKTEEYLVYRYGEDWQIPRRDWITSEHDGAVVSPS